MPQISLRIPDDLQDEIAKWLAVNKSYSQTQLFLAAVRQFISEPQILKTAGIIDRAWVEKIVISIIERQAETLNEV